MSYTSTTTGALARAAVLQHDSWYLLGDMSALITILQQTILTSSTSVTAAILALTVLPKGRPYVIPDGDPAFPTFVRFAVGTTTPPPVLKTYVAGFLFGWDSVLAYILGILGDPNPDSYRAEYQAAVTGLNTYLGSVVGAFNVTTFEYAFALTWAP